MVVQTIAESPRRLSPRLSWALPLLPAAISGFCFSALLYYHLQVGAGVDARGWIQGSVVGMYRLLGFVPAMMLALVAFVWSTIWYVRGTIERPWRRVVRVLALAVTLAILLGLQPTSGGPSGGGVLGGFLAQRLESAVGYVVGTVVVSMAVLFALLLATDMMFFRYFESLARAAAPAGARRRQEDGVENEVVQDMKTLQLEGGFAADLALAEEGMEEQMDARWHDNPEDESDVGEAVAAVAVAPRGGSWRDRLAARQRLAGVEDETAAGEASVEDDSDLDLAVRVIERGDDAIDLDSDATHAESAVETEDDSAHAATRKPRKQEEEEEEEVDEDVEDEDDEDEDEDEDDEDTEDDDLDDYEADDDFDDDEELDDDDDDLDDDEDYDDEDEDDEDEDEDEDDDVDLAADVREATVEIPGRAVAEAATRQGRLFATTDAQPELIAEAVGVVRAAGRASVTFLQRRLRIGFDEAREVLEALRRQGVIDGEEGALQGHVLQD
jgi:hypothetical protein